MDKGFVSYTSTTGGPACVQIDTDGITHIEEGKSESRGNLNVDNSKNIYTYGGSSTATIGDNN